MAGWAFTSLLLTASFIVVTLAVLPLWVLLTAITTMLGAAHGSDDLIETQIPQREAETIGHR